MSESFSSPEKEKVKARGIWLKSATTGGTFLGGYEYYFEGQYLGFGRDVDEGNVTELLKDLKSCTSFEEAKKLVEERGFSK